MKTTARVAWALGLPTGLIAMWWLASSGSTNFFFPPLSQILAAFVDMWGKGRFTSDILPSLERFFAGYLSAALLGVAVGVPIGLSSRLRAYAEPVLEFLRAIPPPVLVPVLMLFAGIGTLMKVLVIISGCVWPVLLNTVEGVRALDPELRDVTRSFRLGAGTVVFRFVLPGASPQIFAGLRQSLSLGVILMVISEMFAASNGIGFMLVQSQRSFAIPEMWSGIVVLGLIGFALSIVFRIIEMRVLGWYFGLRDAQGKSR